MRKARSASAPARTFAARARATKRSVRLVAVIAIIAVAAAAAVSAPSSAKLIDRLIGASAAAAEKASVTTDKGVYEPGETVTFHGSNWTPGETVTIVLSKGTSSEARGTIRATADDHGSFVATMTMPEGEEEVERAAGTKGKAEVIYKAVATGSASGASVRTHFKGREREEEEGDDDADIPRFMVGKIVKEDYLMRRAEHINRMRGIERGKPFDPGARGRAIRDLDRQQGKKDKKSDALKGASVTAAATDESGAKVGATLSGTNFAMAGAPGWTSVGPAPIPNGQTFGVTHAVSGRVTAIAIHPTNPDIAYVAAAQGGVYRTLDGGATWTPIFDDAQTLSIGALALAPSQPSTLYVGTGEGNFSCDSYFGVGVYRIDNADGAAPALTGPFTQDNSNVDVLSGRSIQKVLVHPSNPDVIFIGVTNGIGGLGCDAGTATSSRGLYRSTNATSANATFQKIPLNTANGGNRSVTDMEFEPGNPNTMLATVVGFSTVNDGGVYRSTNALAATPTFTQTLSTGSLTATARTEVAVNKVGGVVTVYAAISDSSGMVKRSVDGGLTWSGVLSGSTGFCGTQCTYDMPIAVDPTNANVVYIGGSADGTLSAILKKSVNATSATPTFTKIQNGLHADAHAIEFDPSNNNIVWFGNDGGVWKSANAGGSWTSLNNTGFNATQFQSLALHPLDPNYMIGGTQDNGTERQRPDGTWTRTDFGDGGYALIDQSATNTTTVRQYHTYFNQASPTAPASALIAFATTTSSTAFENWTLRGCNGGVSNNGISCTDTAVLFYAPMALGPGTPNTVYFGSDKLYRSADSGTTMTAVSQTFVSGVAVSAIGISPQNDSVRIVGLRNGRVYRTVTGANPMVEVTGTLPARYVSRVVVDPNNQNTAYVTHSTYFGNATAHIYKTTNLSDAAPTWTPVGGGQIPDVPVNAFAVDPADSNTLYAGTDIGVYRSMDGGTTWSAFSDGLPRVAVFDMAVQAPSRKLRIATHGRGIWEISVANSPAVIQGIVTDAGNSAPIANASVTAGSNTTTTDESGFYQFQSIPAGTYNMTVAAIGYINGTATNVAATNGSATTRNFALNAAPSAACNVDTTVADFQSGLAANLDVLAPGDVQLALPSPVIEGSTTIQIFSNNITATTWQAQTFTPSVSGKLMQMDFQAALGTTGVPGTLVVEIRNTAAGSPGATVLATANLTTIAGTGNAFYSVPFAAPPNVVAGTQYALVLRAGAGGPFRAVSSLSNVYAGGNWQQSTTSGASWANIVNAGQTLDLVFRSYVVPQVYATSGNLVSAPKDANQADGTAAGWTTLSWNATVPAGTEIKFHAAGSNNPGGLFTFVGPDGTPNTYFNSGDSLAQFNGLRYLKYKAYLSTTNTSLTPTLADVTVCNSNTPLPATSLNVAPSTGIYGGTTTLVATLTTSGSPLAGKTVTFKLNGANFPGNTATTDANGVATIPNISLVGLNAGTYASYVTARFNSDSSYAGSNGTNDLIVEKATPVVVWNNPAPINYGTPLSALQLNATADVPGTFVYMPAAGTVLGGGTQTLSAQFTPADTVNYNTVLKEVSINVIKAELTIKTVDATKVFGAPNPAFTVTYTGFVNGDTPASLGGVLTFTTAATTTSPVGTYAVTPGGLTSPNYTIVYEDGTLTITYGVCVQYDQEKAANSGSTIPVKLQLCDAGGANVSAPGVVVQATSVIQVSTNAPATLADSGNANPDMNFRYTAGTPGMYIFNLSTKGYASGTYLLNFVVSGDPVPHSVKFSVR
ncbi:MAG TPA: MBG domain-containing protein [Pyrinomonadaceae bacterium]